MEALLLRSEPVTDAVAMLVDLGASIVQRCDLPSCEVCGPVLDAAA